MQITSKDGAKTHFRRHDRIRSFDMHNSTVHSVSWSADGRRLASGSLDKNVCVSTLDNYKLKLEFTCRGHSDQVDQVSWHCTNPDLLASASGDKTVRVWDVRNKKAVNSCATKGQNINVGWSPEGNFLVAGDKDDRFTIIDTRTWKIFKTESIKREANEFAFDPTGNYFFLATGNGEIPIYKFPEMNKVVTLQAHPQQALCLSIKMDPMAKHFAVGAGDALVSIWDLKNLTCLRTIDRLDWPVRAVSFSWDGKLLAAGSEDLLIDIAWVETGERVWDLKCEGASYTVAWHPKEYILAFSCEDRPSEATYRRGNVKLFGLTQDQI